MSLLTSYGDTNKVEHTALYTRVQCVGKVAQKDSTSLYEWHRYRTKSWSFVGMDRATAISCANAKIQQLTRSFNVWDVDTENATATSSVKVELQADVQVVHDDGSMWHVDINVNEDDVAYSNTGTSEPGWPSAPASNYDEPTSSTTTTTTT